MKEPQSKRAHSSGDVFFQCAAVFLPYLIPSELASISSTCNTLYQIAKQVTTRRTSDASRAFENVPIPFLNPVVGDSQPYPYFLYAPTQVLQLNPDLRQPWGSDNESQVYQGHTRPDPFLFRVEGGIDCGCVDKGGICDNCPCMECGPSCMCRFGCGNRMTQGGVSFKLKIVKDYRKGWGLYAAELIPGGKFVCEYTGELISTKESRQRQQKYDELASNGCLTPALLVVKEHLPSGNLCMRINIDATRIGNVARFINHSCDGGNLDTVIVRSSGSLLPRVCFFASREIQLRKDKNGDTRGKGDGIGHSVDSHEKDIQASSSIHITTSPVIEKSMPKPDKIWNIGERITEKAVTQSPTRSEPKSIKGSKGWKRRAREKSSTPAGMTDKLKNTREDLDIGTYKGQIIVSHKRPFDEESHNSDHNESAVVAKQPRREQ